MIIKTYGYGTLADVQGDSYADQGMSKGEHPKFVQLILLSEHL